MRSADLAGVDLLDQAIEHGVVIAHVADGRRPRHQVEQRAVLLQVRVHFVHAGHERAARAVDADLARRRRAVQRLNCSNRSAVHDDAHRSGQSLGLWIKDADVTDADGRAIAMRHGFFDIDEALLLPARREAAQARLLALISLTHHDRAGTDRGEQLALVVQQKRLRREIDAAERVARDGQGAALALHLDVLTLFQPQRAAGERRQGLARRLQEGAGIDPLRPRAAGLSHIEPGRGQLGRAVTRGVRPLRLAARLAELFRHFRAEGGGALDGPLDRQAVLAHAQGLGDGRPAPVVLDVEIDRRDVALGRRDQMPDDLAAGDDRKAGRVRNGEAARGQEQGGGEGKGASHARFRSLAACCVKQDQARSILAA